MLPKVWQGARLESIQQPPVFADQTHPLKSGIWSGIMQFEDLGERTIVFKVFIPDVYDDAELSIWFSDKTQRERLSGSLLPTTLSMEQFKKGCLCFYMAAGDRNYFRVTGRVSIKDENLLTGVVEKVQVYREPNREADYFDVELVGTFMLCYQPSE